jgi:hypothetical protein
MHPKKIRRRKIELRGPGGRLIPFKELIYVRYSSARDAMARKAPCNNILS